MVVEQDSGLPMARSGLAYVRLIEGYANGANAGGQCAKRSATPISASSYAKYQAGPGTTGKKKILVYQEQGFGDAILALRLIPMLARRAYDSTCGLPAACQPREQRKGPRDLIRSKTRPDPRTLGCDFASTLFGLISALGVDHQELIRNPTFWFRHPPRFGGEAPAAHVVGPAHRTPYGGNPTRRDDWFRAFRQRT